MPSTGRLDPLAVKLSPDERCFGSEGLCCSECLVSHGLELPCEMWKPCFGVSSPGTAWLKQFCWSFPQAIEVNFFKGRSLGGLGGRQSSAPCVLFRQESRAGVLCGSVLSGPLGQDAGFPELS